MKRETLLAFFRAVVDDGFMNSIPLSPAQHTLLWSAFKRNSTILNEGNIAEETELGIGDDVKITNQDHLNQHLVGLIGEITAITPHNDGLPYEVRLKGHGYVYFKRSEFERYDPN